MLAPCRQASFSCELAPSVNLLEAGFTIVKWADLLKDEIVEETWLELLDLGLYILRSAVPP